MTAIRKECGLSETVDVEATGTRGMLPSTLAGRELRLSYLDTHGNAREVKATRC